MEYKDYSLFYSEFDPQQIHGYKFSGQWKSRVSGEYRISCGDVSFYTNNITLSLEQNGNVEARIDKGTITFESGDTFSVYCDGFYLFAISVG